MPNYFFEPPIGAIDGVNTTFTVSTGYAPGSIAVYTNGVLGERSSAALGGWVETDPAAGVFDMLVAPIAGDRLDAFFADAPFVAPEAITKLKATVRELGRVSASVRELFRMSGQARELERILGSVRELELVSGSVREVEKLAATVKVCL